MSTATTGRAREYRVRDELVTHGWRYIMRAAGSKGPADLLLAHPDHGPILVQVGTDRKTLSPTERVRFVTAAAMCRARPILATATRTGITYHVVNTLTPKWWGEWNPEAPL